MIFLKIEKSFVDVVGPFVVCKMLEIPHQKKIQLHECLF